MPIRSRIAPKRARVAPRGQRTIRLTIALWANDIADGKGMIRSGHAWNSGTVYMMRNKAHGITPQRPEPFGDRRGLDELPFVIRRVLRKHRVTVYPRRRRSN